MSAECPLCRKIAEVATLPPDEVVAELPGSVVLLGPWQYHTGYCILVSREHVTELHHLAPAARTAFLDDVCRVSRAIEQVFRPLKINVESLGNQVPHLHCHVFPRRPDDPERLKPVWIALDRAERDLAEKTRLETGPWPRSEIASRLRQALGNP